MEEASKKIDSDLKKDINEEKGIDSKQAMKQSLDEFGKMDEMDFMKDAVSGMLARAAESHESVEQEKAKRQKKIKEQVDKAEKKYGKQMTPANPKGVAASSKTHGL